MLANRAVAWKLKVMGASYDKALYETLNGEAVDPLTHTLLGQHFETLEDSDLAEEHFNKAVEFGPGMAMPHWLLGFHHLDDPSKRATTNSAWSRYLEFEPTGERATRAIESLGR